MLNCQLDTAVQPLRKWSHLSIKPQQNQADTWVHLLELPHPFSFDQALLLCQHSEDKWVAWIPNYGEAVLHISQFC